MKSKETKLYGEDISKYKDINIVEGEVWRTFINPENGKKTKYLVSNYGRIYNTKTSKFMNGTISHYMIKRNKKGEQKKYTAKPRVSINLVDESADLKFGTSLARVIMLTFKFIYNYNEMEVDHIDGDPLNNKLSNLEWVTPSENKRSAKKHYLENKTDRKDNQVGGYTPTYTDEFIHVICQDICKGLTRKELREKYKINGQLIDDLRSGRSHKDITSLYVDKGFTYRIHTKKEKEKRRKLIHKICKMIDDGFTNKEIVELLELPQNEVCLPNDIRKYRVYCYISKDYKFGEGITQTKFKERI